jgi:hypothetical protein
LKLRNFEKPNKYTAVVTMSPIYINIIIRLSVVVEPEKNMILISSINIKSVPIFLPIAVSSIGYLVEIKIPTNGINELIILILFSSEYSQRVVLFSGI